MPNTREKLIELFMQEYERCQNTLCFECKYDHDKDCGASALVDHLIANGVTVQEWISVKDRLPEAGTKALCYLKRGEYWTAVWDDCGDNLWSDGEAWCSNGEVTHWMPLPEPPKGD